MLADRFVLLKTGWAWPWGSKTNCSPFCASPLNSLIPRAEARTIPHKDWSFEWWTFSFSFFPNRNLAGNFHFRTKVFFVLFCFLNAERFQVLLDFSPQRNLLCYFKSHFSASLITWQLCWWILFQKMTACRVQVLDGWLKFNSLHCV